MNPTKQFAPLPDWMERIKQEHELEEARAEVETLRNKAAGLQLAAEAPDFWARFVKELQFQTPLLDSIGIRASASLSPSSKDTPDEICHIEIAKKDSLIPRISRQDFFYGKGGRSIRCYSDGRNILFQFQVYPDGLKVVYEYGNYSAMDAVEMAVFVLQRMVQVVK